MFYINRIFNEFRKKKVLIIHIVPKINLIDVFNIQMLCSKTVYEFPRNTLRTTRPFQKSRANREISFIQPGTFALRSVHSVRKRFHNCFFPPTSTRHTPLSIQLAPSTSLAQLSFSSETSSLSWWSNSKVRVLRSSSSFSRSIRVYPLLHA